MNNTRHLTRRMTRRGSTRTTTSLGKVELDKQQKKRRAIQHESNYHQKFKQ